MKKTIKFIALACAVMSIAVSCEHPDTDEVLPYYFKENMAYLGKVDRTFEMLHTLTGVTSENVKMPFTVGVAKALDKDLTVELEIDVKGENFVKENVAFANGNVVTIPAGELTVDNELQILDWAFATANKDAATYEINVRIRNVVPSSAVLIANEMNRVTYRINKSIYSNVKPGETPSGTQVSNDERTKWDVRVSMDPSDEEWTETKALVDGGFLMEVIDSEGDYLGVQIDMHRKVMLTGMYGNFLRKKANWPIMSSLEISTDGSNWVELMSKTAVSQEKYQYIAFAAPAEARFVRWRFWGEKSLCMDEVYVYVQSE